MAITILAKERYLAGYLIVVASSDALPDRALRVSFSNPFTPNAEIKDAVRDTVQVILADEKAQRKADRVAARVSQKIETLGLYDIATTEVETEGGY